MIELRAPHEVTEEYILDLMEYATEWSKAVYVFIKSIKEEDDQLGSNDVPSNNELIENEGLHLFDRETKRDFLLLTHQFTQMYPPLNQYSVFEDAPKAIVQVAVFLSDLIDASQASYGELTAEGRQKAEEYVAIRSLVWEKIDTWYKLEKMLELSQS